MSEPLKITIKDWAEEDRPREKLLMKGPSVLSDSELLAILISSGNDKESAVELSRRILQKANNDLYTLGRFSVNDLIKNFRGIGTAKAVTIAAAMELGRRRKEKDIAEKKKISSSKDAYQYLYAAFADLPHEETWILLLNNANYIIAAVQISKGGISCAEADFRMILREALNQYASRIILAHNHPSGNCKPSLKDTQVTKRLKEAAQLMEITLLDHLIICAEEYYSFADNEMI